MGWDEIYKHPILDPNYKVKAGESSKIKLDENT
jgi:hypothetical protein